MSNSIKNKAQPNQAQQIFMSGSGEGEEEEDRNNSQQVGGTSIKSKIVMQQLKIQRHSNSSSNTCKKKSQGRGTSSTELLIRRIFKSTQKFEEFNEICQQQKRQICSNMIGKSDLYFQCFDCNKESQDTIICHACFLKGSHSYHKVVYFNDMDDGGQCDCGDTSQKYPTFCDDHPLKKKETEHEKQRMLALIPPEITERLTNYFEEEFIKLFNALDSAKSGQYFSISQDIHQLLNSMNFLMSNRVPMIYLISDLLTKHLDFQPSTYEKHIQDEIITINQSPYPNFLTKNKKSQKKKRTSKEIQEESSLFYQNQQSSTLIQPSSTNTAGMAIEDDLQGSPFNLSSGSPTGLNQKQRSNGDYVQPGINQNGGFSIKNSLFNSVQKETENQNSIPSPLVQFPTTPSNNGMNLWNSGLNMNNFSLFASYPQQVFQQQIAQGVQFPSTLSVGQNYLNQNMTDGGMQLNDAQTLLNTISSLQSLGDTTNRSNQVHAQFNTAPNTPYNSALSQSQFNYPSPFFNTMAGMMSTPFAFQTMPSPFWTYSPYISNSSVIPTFANKIDNNFTLASNAQSSSTSTPMNPSEWQMSQIFQQNAAQLLNQQNQQQSFILPPPLQLLQNQENNNQIPQFAQQSTIQEASLFAAPSPIQRIVHSQQIEYNEMEKEKDNNSKHIDSNQLQNLSNQNNQQVCTSDDNQHPIQNKEDSKSSNNNKPNSGNIGGINIFKFLSTSRVSFGMGDSQTIFQNQQNKSQIEKSNDENENNQMNETNRISFSSSFMQQQSKQPKEQQQQLFVQNPEFSTPPQIEPKKLNIFDEDDNIGQFSQFKKQPQKQFYDFPSVPKTPNQLSSSISKNQDTNNSSLITNFKADMSLSQSDTSQQQNCKMQHDIPTTTQQNNDLTNQCGKQGSNTQSSNINYTQCSSESKESPQEAGLSQFMLYTPPNPESSQNNYLTKKLLNELSNQTLSNLTSSQQDKDQVNQQNQINNNDLENKSKSSQEQNFSHIKENQQNQQKGNNDQNQKSTNMMEEESEEANSRSPSKIGREDTQNYTMQQKEHQQQIINQILKRRATLDIDEILGGDNQSLNNNSENSIKKKQFIEEQKEQNKCLNKDLSNNIANPFDQNQIFTNEKEKFTDKQNSMKTSGLKSSATMELEKEKWCLLELLFLYYPKFCNDQTDKSLQRVIMIAFLDWSFRPLLVKLYTTYFDLIIETSKFEFYLWKICFQFFNESLESDFVINNTIMIEKVVKGVEIITKNLQTKKYAQSSSKRKILETMVLAFLQQRNAKYYGRSNKNIIQLYLESMSQSDLLRHIDFDHGTEYLRFEAILTRMSQLINRNVRSIYYIDQSTFSIITKSILKQINTFITGPLFIEFIASYSVPSLADLKRKDDGEDAEKMYPLFNNKIRIFLIYFAQFYIESTSIPPLPQSFSQNNIPNAAHTSQLTQISQQIPAVTTRTSITLASTLNPIHNSNSIPQLPNDNLGDNFDFYTLLKTSCPEEFSCNEKIDNLLINMIGYMTKVLLFVELKERNYDLNDPTSQLLAEEEGFDNPNSELSLLQLYKSSKLYDYDFASLQFIFTLIPNNNLTLQAMWQSISSLVKKVDNKQQKSAVSQISLYELTIDKIIADPQTQLNLEFLFFTLCNLSLNSISLLNSLSPNQKLQHISWMKQSVEFSVIMSFFDKPLQDFYQIKENLKERFEINVQYLDLEGCVSKVAEWDENHKKFRLKKEFQNMVEPYCGERNRALANDMYSTLKQQMQRDLTSDLVLGNMLEFMEIKRCHNEKKNRRNIFSQNQQHLLRNQNFMLLLGRICENLKEISAVNMNLAKHTLKLLQIIFLRSSIDRKNYQINQNNNQDKSGVQSNVSQQSSNPSQQQSNQTNQKNNVNTLLQEDLMLYRLFVSNQKIKEQLTNYGVGKEDDLKRSTKKMISIFNAFQEVYQKENQIILMQIRRRNSSIDEENKKSEIKNQQQRIMEEFRKKQLNFQNKSSNNANDSSLNSNKLATNTCSNKEIASNCAQSTSMNQQNQHFMNNPSINCLNDQENYSQFSDIELASQKFLMKQKRLNYPPQPECLICRTSSTERSAILVIPCYFTHDNLFSYFLKEQFCNARLTSIQEKSNSPSQKKNRKNNQKINKINQQKVNNDGNDAIEIESEEEFKKEQFLSSYQTNNLPFFSNFKRDKFSWSFTGCSHQVHSKCHQDAQQNLTLKKKARSNPDDAIHQNESFCAHCKSLLNIHLINIEYYMNTYQYTQMIQRINYPSQSNISNNENLTNHNNNVEKENGINNGNQREQESEQQQPQREKKSSISSLFTNCNSGNDTGYLSLPDIIEEVRMIDEDRIQAMNLQDLIREDIDESQKVELENLLNQLRNEIKIVAQQENIATLFMKCTYFMSERYLNKDVINYIQKELPMCKSMILNFAVLLSLDPPSTSVITSMKNRLIVKLQGMVNLNELILKQIDKNDSIDEIFVEILNDVLLLGFLYNPKQQSTEESKKIYEDKGRERPRDGFEWTFVIVTSLLKIIKMNVVVQVACLLHVSSSTTFIQNPSQSFGFASILESIKSNSQFRSSLFNMVRPFIQMMICFLLTIFPFNQTQIELLQKNILLDEDEYVHYETILSKEFMTIDPIKTIQTTGGEAFLKSFIQILQNQQEQIKIQQFFIHNPSREFKLVSLPIAYADFHKTFFFRKCSLCKNFPQTKGSDFHVCLICGEVLCSYSCTPLHSPQRQNQKKGDKSSMHNHGSVDMSAQKMILEDQEDNSYKEKLLSNMNVQDHDIGNLSRHSLQMHCGKSAFLNIQRTTYILIDFPKAMQFHAKVFSNRIGIPFLTGKPLVDWNKYFIDKKIIDHITQIIQDRQISQYMRHQLMIKQSDSSLITCSLMSQPP